MVQKLHWTSLYSTGIEKVDSQHQWMMELINRALSALAKKDQDELVARSLISLVEYSKQHFADEEALMKAGHYPGLTGHKEQHDQHLRQLAREILTLNEGKLTNVESFRDFLKSWLIKHILHEDKKAAEYIFKHAPEVLRDDKPVASVDEVQSEKKSVPSN